MAEKNSSDGLNLMDMSTPNKDSNGAPMPVTFSEEEYQSKLQAFDEDSNQKLQELEKEYEDKIAELKLERDELNHKFRMAIDNFHIVKVVMEEFSTLCLDFKAKREIDNQQMARENQNLKKERDQALDDLKNVESAFADLHRRYEHTKSIVETFKENEDCLKNQLKEKKMYLDQQEQKFNLLKNRTEEKLESANKEIESARKGGETEKAVLSAQLKKSEMKLMSLQKNLEQKTRENQELSNICDELIAKVGKS